MNYHIVEKNNLTYVEFEKDGWVVRSEKDALDLVAACGEFLTDRLLVYEENLAEDFFHLSTHLAGEVMLKLSNYRIRVAIVTSPERLDHGKIGRAHV